jgi:hypothetical protein
MESILLVNDDFVTIADSLIVDWHRVPMSKRAASH